MSYSNRRTCYFYGFYGIMITHYEVADYSINLFKNKKFIRWPSHKQWLELLVWAVVLGAIGFFGLFIYLERTLPDADTIATRQVSESTKIYDRTGQVLLYDIHGEEKRTIIPWEQIPANAKNATLAAEDSNFYSHGGFDVRGIARSFFKDVLSLSLSQGGFHFIQN